MKRTGLRLRAVDAEDVAMFSALMQDALVELPHFVFDRVGRRFGGFLVRFRHEERRRGPAAPMRQVKCALAFDDVTAVRYRAVDPKETRPLELLAMSTDDAPSPRHATLHFAGGGALRVEFERLSLRLEDVGDPWITAIVPDHGSEP